MISYRKEREARKEHEKDFVFFAGFIKSAGWGFSVFDRRVFVVCGGGEFCGEWEV